MAFCGQLFGPQSKLHGSQTVIRMLNVLGLREELIVTLGSEKQAAGYS